MFAFHVDDRIQMRLLQQHHAEELFAVTEANRAHLREWLPWLDATTAVQDSMDFVVMSIYTFAQKGLMVCGIWLDDALVGVVGHNEIDPESRTTKLGYWLAEAAEGQGVMTRCVAAFVDHAFSEYDLVEVQIRVAVHNTRSRGLPERLGFVQGELVPNAERLHDRTVDHVVYRMRAPGWRQPSG